MNSNYLRFTSTIALTLTIVALSCSSSSDCNETSTCAPTGGSTTGGNGVGGGHSGAAGSSASAGDNSSGAPDAAGAAGFAGAAGTAGAPPCEGACTGTTPVCDATTNSCVECTGSTHCAGAKPVCDTVTDTCVECNANTDCGGATPLCDTTKHACVACLAQSDCTTATASACVAGQCQPCTADADCSNIAGKGVCNAGACVECTGTKFTACGQNAGTPQVCDSLAHACTTTKQHSAGICQPCVSDAQCDAGKICVLDKFGTPATDVGYFCHWKKGDTLDGAPALCSSAPPFVGTQAAVTSIDGEVSDICKLSVSTCIARNQYRSKDCAVAGAPSDAMCGFSATKDSKCVMFDVGVYKCTMACAGDPDCPSNFTCNTGATPSVCNVTN